MSDQHNREYGILEIQQSRLKFRYNLNSLRTEEKEIWLSAVYVDDGQWHIAKVEINLVGKASLILFGVYHVEYIECNAIRWEQFEC